NERVSSITFRRRTIDDNAPDAIVHRLWSMVSENITEIDFYATGTNCLDRRAAAGSAAWILSWADGWQARRRAEPGRSRAGGLQSGGAPGWWGGRRPRRWARRRFPRPGRRIGRDD